MSLTYICPFLFHILFGNVISEHYRIGGYMQWAALFIVFFAITVRVFQRSMFKFAPSAHIIPGMLCHLFVSRINYLVGGFSLFLAYQFMQDDGFSFRQSGEQLLQANIYIRLTFVVKPYVYAWIVFNALAAILQKNYDYTRGKLQGGLFFISLFISVGGSLEIIPVVWLFIFVVSSRSALSRLFISSPRDKRDDVRNLVRLIVLLPLLVVMGTVAVAIGFINKIGLDVFMQSLSSSEIFTMIESSMLRVSSSYASVIAFVNNHLTDLSFYETAWSIPFENLRYRVSVLFFPDDFVDRPEITSISRLNYISAFTDDSLLRAGASPGLVATAFYAAPIPLGFIIISIYTVFVVRILDLPFDHFVRKPSFLALAFCTTFILPMFETPLDFLIIFDPSVFQAILIPSAFWAAGYYARLNR